MRELESLAVGYGLRLTAKRRIILGILEEARWPVSAREVHARALELDRRLSLASVNVTLRALLAHGLLTAAPLTGRTMGYSRADLPHIERLIDVRSGRGRDFRSAGMRFLLEETARALGYRLLDYRLELFGTAHCAGPAAGESSRRRRSRILPQPSAGSAPAIRYQLRADTAQGVVKPGPSSGE